MDQEHFDTLIRTLTVPRSRRGLLVRVTGGLGAMLLLGLETGDTAAKPKKKHKHHNKHHAAAPPPASPPPSPAVPAGPTCTDGVKNGRETGVDCGGPDCPACESGRTCAVNTDCRTARCGDGDGTGTTCQSCTADGVCGSDSNGGCLCDAPTGICRTDSRPPLVQSCDVCQPDEVCGMSFDGFFCF